MSWSTQCTRKVCSTGGTTQFVTNGWPAGIRRRREPCGLDSKTRRTRAERRRFPVPSPRASTLQTGGSVNPVERPYLSRRVSRTPREPFVRRKPSVSDEHDGRLPRPVHTRRTWTILPCQTTKTTGPIVSIITFGVCVHAYTVVVSREVCVPPGPWLLRQRRPDGRALRSPRFITRPGVPCVTRTRRRPARMSAAALIFYETLPPLPLSQRPAHPSAVYVPGKRNAQTGDGREKCCKRHKRCTYPTGSRWKITTLNRFWKKKLRDTPTPPITSYFEQSQCKKSFSSNKRAMRIKWITYL